MGWLWWGVISHLCLLEGWHLQIPSLICMWGKHILAAVSCNSGCSTGFWHGLHKIPICVVVCSIGECRPGTVAGSGGQILVQCYTKGMWRFGIVQCERDVCWAVHILIWVGIEGNCDGVSEALLWYWWSVSMGQMSQSTKDECGGVMCVWLWWLLSLVCSENVVGWQICWLRVFWILAVTWTGACYATL